MRFEQVLTDLDVLDRRGDLGVDVVDVTSSTADVVERSVFCCVPGARVDGHEFATAAVERGAVALLCERLVDVDVAQARVADVRGVMGRAAAAVHAHPSRDLAVVGVTGTNGKTTVTHLVAGILEAHGWPTQVTGTMSGARTTPEAPELQRRLAHWRDEGGRAAAIEVSSAALVAHRVDGMRFAVAVFTNFGTDHIGEVHPDEESYFAAKASLFRAGLAQRAVVNADDDRGRQLLASADVPMESFSLADAEALDVGLTGSRFRWRGVDVQLALGGLFNVSNALAAASACAALGVPEATIADGLASVREVRGHAQPVDAGQPFAVLVDYAHTPEAVAAVLDAARRGAAPDGRVIVVFGCGGDRDRAKRPLMGSAAGAGADTVIVTSDNPRSEDPRAIVDDVLAGVGQHPDLVVEVDRRAAIHAAVARARPGDVVVIAGKGHETGQTTGEVTHPFDDHDVALEAIEEVLR